ncbi:hypothetical protein A2154_01995 [Candidatus Gottesmanbacteria bacterium RBG_16_43_7]|uniref:Queuine tRNA-ribosyltransferase n=1 Tax=Candidatus Gottesmanbacteria bacterium RBG_16_43_7 TaxID=1798373 RepID=A0A1F5Z852_9BACT|nr:MAG: hypothetical protein A2154_01995 [Candidatus Gottesmanbacteria bacterium RBG_16_43_7]
MAAFSFQIKHQDRLTQARLGRIVTPHGSIDTPAFVPVGTQATVKSLTPDELNTLGIQLFFVNTYHIYLRPGVNTIKAAGGLHGFMGWDKPLITDSGGFQIFSLGAKKYINIAISESAVLDRQRFTRKQSKKEGIADDVFPDDYRPVGTLVTVDEDGVTFTSHWDGTKHRFTPEISTQLQYDLKADLTIAFDECAPFPTTYDYAQKAMDRTHRWADRCLRTSHKLKSKYRSKYQQALYGVVQGSVYRDLRIKSAETIGNMDFDGIAIGGVAVGESKTDVKNVLEWTIPHLPAQLPRHLLGVGKIDDIFTLVAAGIDTFDCVQPTRLARMGHLLVTPVAGEPVKYVLDITKGIYARDMRPISDSCSCYTCGTFSRSYIHHLFRVRELLAYRLATIHNLHFMQSLMDEIRGAIRNQSFSRLLSKWIPD